MQVAIVVEDSPVERWARSCEKPTSNPGSGDCDCELPTLNPNIKLVKRI